jgi:aminopeptidase N
VDITARYDEMTGRIHGQMRIAIPNTTKAAWSDLGFVLHANNQASYVGCSTTIESASVAGKAVTARLVEENRGVLLPLSQSLMPGEWVTCEIDFVTQVSQGEGRIGILSRNEDSVTWYSWLPEPAIYTDGWHFPAITMMSDPSFVRCCDYRARITLPPDWTLICSGDEQRQADGSWLVRAARCRKFVAWLTNQAVETMTLDTVTGPLIRVSFIGKFTIQAAFVASVCRDTMAIAHEQFGPYPRRSYDVVFTHFTEDVGGLEASGLTYLHQAFFQGLDRTATDPLLDPENPVLLAGVHEVLHSWWYDQVGNDTGSEPWLDEPLTEWSSWYVVERLRGRKAMEKVALTRLSALFAIVNDMKPLNSNGKTMSDMQFGILLYCRGPFLYEALRAEVGEQVFFDALRRWYATYAGATVNRQAWDAHFLTLLPAERRATFAHGWIESVDAPVPAALDALFPQAASIRSGLLDHKNKVPATTPAGDQPPGETTPVQTPTEQATPTIIP